MTNGANGVVAFCAGDDCSETVNFKDAEKEELLQELEQALAERSGTGSGRKMTLAHQLKIGQHAGSLSFFLINAWIFPILVTTTDTNTDPHTNTGTLILQAPT